jgi:hypothetical protein
MSVALCVGFFLPHIVIFRYCAEPIVGLLISLRLWLFVIPTLFLG